MAINHGLQAQIFRLSSIRTKYPGYSNLIYDSNGKIINRPICGPKIQPRVFKKPDTAFYKQAKPTRANPKKMPKENTEETDITWRTTEHRDKNDS
ncbi:hypothetical protein FOQG_08371 [Fusarium oxysporum f. sp. raphani 54005]|uniref:Uncharacterized protein n=2 Tax=Fusarium oxysporum f. sp. raphani TaxID=96318 RepID=X0CCL0_FUSOX|nr:hypothetical protein FOQG_08371 [Fusarium oxysporum f. sp. raphani 54005]KAG7435632.1 hypothetical protein Forpi1262_v003402 [Fusarium oxysporum f. sp. raphani]KAJ4037042.1 hypothetical protein NW758_009630 [Fusarium oxysporum]WKT42493.1 hypothetical protein QSH57_007329 [Fusarium oxysporum f. sp. vasinfectum]KAJ4044174.1 hypothetical protein NW763_011045 [Fusarium oxysporum]